MSAEQLVPQGGHDAKEHTTSVRRLAVGAVLGFVVVLVLVVAMCEIIGISLGAAAGVGVFVALFGGAGYGAMVAGSL